MLHILVTVAALGNPATSIATSTADTANTNATGNTEEPPAALSAYVTHPPYFEVADDSWQIPTALGLVWIGADIFSGSAGLLDCPWEAACSSPRCPWIVRRSMP